MRPFCREFLENMSKIYEIIIFTASTELYAETVRKFLDPENIYIKTCLTRDNCMETKNGFIIKDLRIFSSRNLENLIIVDNLSHSFCLQIDNGIPILEWHSDTSDTELKFLQLYLEQANKVKDVREFNCKYFKLKKLAELSVEDLLL